MNASYPMSEYTHQNTDVIQMVLGIYGTKDIGVRSIAMTGELAYHV